MNCETRFVRITLYLMAAVIMLAMLAQRVFGQPPEPPAGKPAEQAAGVLPDKAPPALWRIEALEGVKDAVPPGCSIEVHTAITFPAQAQGKEIRFTQATIEIKLPGQIQGIVRQNDREIRCISNQTKWLVDWSKFVLCHPEQGGPFPHASRFTAEETGFWLATQVILESSQPVDLGHRAKIVFSLM